jgi:hypothetical protein
VLPARYDRLCRHPEAFERGLEPRLEAGPIGDRPSRQVGPCLPSDGCQATPVQRAADDVDQLRRRNWLDEIPQGPVFDRFDRALEVGAPRHENERHVEIRGPDLPQQRLAVHVRHGHVADDDVEGGRTRGLDGLLASEGDHDLVPFARQHSLGRPRRHRLVVDYQNTRPLAGGVRAAHRGIVSQRASTAQGSRRGFS